MKKLGMIFSGFAAMVLSGCFAAPMMQMSAPEDSTTYNGMTVRLHSITDGDFGTGASASGDSSKKEFGNLSELIVDTLPELEYRIGPLDMVQVVVWEHPELTSPMGQYQPAGQKVTTDGKLFYPYAGELQAEGLTAQELRTEITKRLSDKILNAPQVDVRVTGYHSRRALVSGAVNRPGYISFDENPKTIPDAIADAGGFDETADPSVIQLRRGDKVYEIDYLDAFKTNLPLDRMLMQPNDQLFVASAEETQKEQKVYVLGEVGRIGTVNIHNGNLTLVEALSTAGGLQTLNASSHSIYVIRNTSETQLDVYHLDAKNAMALAMANKFNMNAKDIVYVDASGLATWNRIISLIYPSIQAVYYGVLTGRNIQIINSDMKDK